MLFLQQLPRILFIDSAPEGMDLSFTKSFAAVPRELKKKRGNTRRNVETMGQTSL